MAPSIWWKLSRGVQVKLIAAGLALGGAAQPAAQGAETRLEIKGDTEGRTEVRVEVQGGGRVEARAQAQVQGGGQAQMQVWINGAPMIQPVGPTSQPARVEAALTVTQQKPGGPAVLRFAVPAKAGFLAALPEATTFFGAVKPAPGSLTKTGCAFVWDVETARKQAPALRGTEVRINWKLAREALKSEPQPPATDYVTVAHLTLTPEGAVALADVQTSPALSRLPLVCEMAPMPVYRYTFTADDLTLTAVRFEAAKSTSLTARLQGGHRFTAQPGVKTTVGALAARRKWDPNQVNTAETVTLNPPEKLPEKDLEGTVTWTWTSEEPLTGEQGAGTLTLTVKMDPAGNLTIQKTESQSKVTKPGRRPEVCEMAPRSNWRAAPGAGGKDLPLASRFQAAIRSQPAGPGSLRLTAEVAYTDREGLSFAWQTTGGAIDHPSAGEVTWTLPLDPGKYLAQVVVTDRHGGMAVPALIVDVTAGGRTA